LADGARCLARTHVPAELAVADDVDPLRGHAFIVMQEAAQARAVRQRRVANRIDNLRTVP